MRDTVGSKSRRKESASKLVATKNQQDPLS